MDEYMDEWMNELWMKDEWMMNEGWMNDERRMNEGWMKEWMNLSMNQ